jgi:mannose-1-phosphate guanylyltransferase
MKLQPNDSPGSAVRCGIILSGGNGKRLRDVVYRRRADYLPKQCLNFIGRRSLLEHTLHRAEKLIPAQQLFIVLSKEHLQFDEVRHQIASRPRQCVLIQPDDKDTGPGLLLSLLRLHKQYPETAVAVFPADHFILEEDLFMQYVDHAFCIVESDGSRIVLLGVEPNEPDPEYGYIVPSGRIDNPDLDGARTIEMFVEKPSADAAKTIMRKGALWNTLVLVVACKTLLQAIKRAAPELYRSFEPIQDAIGTPDEERVTERAYHMLPPLNFSKGVLEVLPFEHRQGLLVLPVRGVTWSDWGTADHRSSTLQRLGASEVVPSASVLQDTEQVGRGLSQVTGGNVQENRVTAVKEVEVRRNGRA